jgi:hypothetical protein
MKNKRLRLVVASLAVIAVLLAVVAAAARSPRWRPRPPVVPSFSVGLEDASGTPLPTFAHGGQSWVLGEQGDRYAIVIRNPTAERVEAVVSVDGRDAITGRVANFRRSRGYIVQPFGMVRVEGFRQSLDQVATFRFSSPGASYSARMGTPENVGIIGVAFFRERVREVVASPEEFGSQTKRKSRRVPAPRAATPPRAGAAEDGASNIGTEYGESRTSRVIEVPFERVSNTPTRVITLRYDDADGLEARGIDVFPRHRFERPLPFSPRPRAFADDRFAPPP